MRRCAALLLVCVLIVPAARATTARVRALGGQGDLREDDTGVFTSLTVSHDV